MRRFLVLHSSLQNHSFVKREYDGLLNILASDFDAQFDFLDNLESLPSSSKYEDFIISTGGVENIFLDLLKRNLVGTNVTLIADGRFNSLAASMEILTYLNNNNIKAFIAYGSNEEISARLKEHPNVDFVNEHCGSAALSLSGDKIAVFGEPSDWLIASNVDRDFLKQKFNIDSSYIHCDLVVY